MLIIMTVGHGSKIVRCLISMYCIPVLVYIPYRFLPMQLIIALIMRPSNIPLDQVYDLGTVNHYARYEKVITLHQIVN